MLRFMGRKESDTTEGLISDGFPSGSDGKESACNARDRGSIPGLGRSPGEGDGNPFQYSCLGNLMYRRAWQATRLNTAWRSQQN